jgi:hypothetical protein
MTIPPMACVSKQALPTKHAHRCSAIKHDFTWRKVIRSESIPSLYPTLFKRLALSFFASSVPPSYEATAFAPLDAIVGEERSHHVALLQDAQCGRLSISGALCLSSDSSAIPKASLTVLSISLAQKTKSIYHELDKQDSTDLFFYSSRCDRSGKRSGRACWPTRPRLDRLARGRSPAFGNTGHPDDKRSGR